MAQKTFIGRFENLSLIGAFVSQAARKAGLDDEAIYAVELAVDEAATNIIEHGYGGETNGQIYCSCENLGNGLKIVLLDHGREFDPDVVPEPTFHGKSIENITPRGLGLFFIKKLMDEVKFEFSQDQGNRLTMVKLK